MRLSELQSGEKGVIVKVLGHGGFRKRIVEMGFIKGKTVEVILNAPLKDPIKYRILGYEVSLRRSEAEMIEVISKEEALKLLKEDEILEGLPEDIDFPEEQLQRIALGRRRTIKVALVGNPNSGKTSLFNIASGAHERVGNYGGVTVDAREGYFDFEGYRFKLVDLPGTYSLSAYSPEEKYVREHLIEETPDVVINVVDASNLERNLYLTTQLIDMNLRMVVALNIYDELEASGDTLDYVELSKHLGIPMVPTVSKHNKGISTLFHIIINLYEGVDYMDEDGELQPEAKKQLEDWHKTYVDESNHPRHLEDYTGSHKVEKKIYRHIHINHGQALERVIDQVKAEISKNETIRHKFSTRFLAVKLLERDAEIEEVVAQFPNADAIFDYRNSMCKEIFEETGETCESAITDAKYSFIDGLLKQTLSKGGGKPRKVTEKIDALVTHRFWGYPIFLLFMYIMFSTTFILGEYPMEGIEWLVEQLGNFVGSTMPDGVFKDMLVNGVITGVGGVIVFLPNILILYFFISIMEDSGYMARAAFIMDKLMQKLGLHGKSFIPLLMGFGCNVPAIMASRTIENRKTRLVTILVNPLMSCSARLPIYLILIGAFFPKNQGFILFSIYLIGIVLAILMAKLFTKFLVKGENTPFVMELPPYRMPTGKSIFRHTWEKGVIYLKKMGSVILIASVIVWFLGTYPKGDPSLSHQEQQEQTYIGYIGKAIEPLIAPLGFDWKMGVGLLTGAGAKELVVSTVSVLYGADDDGGDLASRMGITPLIAFGYMVFSLLYFPCVAAIVAVRQEAGSWGWAMFTVVYTTVLAWVVSFLIYQIGGMFL